MNKKVNFSIIFILVFVSLAAGIFQYIQTFKAEIVDAYWGKPNPGHFWSEMECTTGLCVTAGNKVGIGTDNPSDKLNVVGSVGVTGSITASGDVCNASGACLSQLNSFIGTQTLVLSAHTFNMCTTTADGSGFGEVANAGTTQNPVWICRFDKDSCPSPQTGQPNWTAYNNWTTTASAYYTGSTLHDPWGAPYLQACNTGSHAWANLTKESCIPCAYGFMASAEDQPHTVCNGVTGYATIAQIGCY